MAKKIGYDTVAGGSVPPPIDSSLEGAPVQSAVQQPVQQPVKATTPPPVDSSLAGAPGQTTEQKQQEASTNTEKSGVVTSTDTDKPGAGASSDAPKEGTSASTDKENPGNGTSTDYSNDVMGYNDQIALLRKEQARYEEANETPEQQAKREKREKSQRLIAAIGDGLSSLAGLFATAHYAPYVKPDSQYDKEDARLKELKAEREANRDKYLNYALKIGDLENQRANTVRELEAQAEKMKMAREAAQRQAEEHDWLKALQPDIQREHKGKADTAETTAAIKGIEKQYAPSFYKNRADLEGEKIQTERAKQGASRASATHSYAAARAADRSNHGGSGGSSSGGGGKPYGTFLGKSYRTKADYDAAVVGYCRKNGIPLTYNRRTTDGTTGVSNMTQTNRTIAGLRAAAEEHYARNSRGTTSSDNTPPSRRRNNDNTPPSRR